MVELVGVLAPHAFEGELCEAACRLHVEGEGLRADYAEIREPVNLERPQRADAASRLFLAAFVGKTRLIDNGALGESA